MDPRAFEPYGQALTAYFEGDASAELLLRRGDGREDALPVRHFFRGPADFTPLERAAMDLCEGAVLDAGAGTGLHSLYLQERGLPVTAIDISGAAVAIMSKRGVENALQADLFQYTGGPFDTLLMLGHGVGVVEDLAGLDRFLRRAKEWLSKEGRVLLDSMDVRRTRDPRNLAYHDANRRAGRYIGEIEIELEFSGRSGPRMEWLHVDPETLEMHAEKNGWRCGIVHEEESGDFLAKLTRARA